MASVREGRGGERRKLSTKREHSTHRFVEVRLSRANGGLLIRLVYTLDISLPASKMPIQQQSLQPTIGSSDEHDIACADVTVQDTRFVVRCYEC
jgi:hypothetical protein